MFGFFELKKNSTTDSAVSVNAALVQCRKTADEYAAEREAGGGTHAIDAALASAVDYVENYTGKAVDGASYTASFEIAESYEIPRPKIAAVSRVYYIDKDGAETDIENYKFDAGVRFGRIYLPEIPADIADITAPMRVDFSTEKTVEQGLIAAVLIATDIFYQNSGGGDFGALDKLLNLYRIAKI